MRTGKQGQATVFRERVLPPKEVRPPGPGILGRRIRSCGLSRIILWSAILKFSGIFSQRASGFAMSASLLMAFIFLVYANQFKEEPL